MIDTRITRDYGLEAPIASAGMAFVAGPRLAAAVSNAGGLGTLGAVKAPPEALRAMLRATRELTRRPFGVDLITEFAEEEHIDVLCAERVPVVIFFWGAPRPEFVARLQHSDCRLWMQVGSVVEAREAAALGFDAIIAQGSEGGGHNRSSAATFSMLPAVCDAVAPLPVIAAGGISDGRGLAAALALGAEAVWCGTRFLASAEADAHEEYKARVLRASVSDTVRTTLFGPEWPGQRMRVLRNRVVEEWLGREEQAATGAAWFGPIGRTVLGGEVVEMPKYSAILPTPDTSGDFEEMGLTAGESSGNIHHVKPAAEIVREMAEEAAAVGRRLAAAIRK